MNLNELIKMIDGEKYALIAKHFKEFDKKSNSINHYQKAWNLPLEPNSCQLAHKLRNELFSFYKNYTGHNHLDGAKFPAIAINIHLPEVKRLALFVMGIAPKINEVYSELSKVLYPE